MGVGLMRGEAEVASPGTPDSSADLVGRVASSALEATPFAHVYLEDLFPAEYYRRLLDHLPETRRHRELRHREAMQGDGHSARRKFYLFPEHITWLPAGQRAFWRELSRVLRSRALQEVFKSKFRAALEQRFGRGIDRLSFYPVPMLIRDLRGYRIGRVTSPRLGSGPFSTRGGTERPRSAPRGYPSVPRRATPFRSCATGAGTASRRRATPPASVTP
jgi:hypothetical protein